MFVKIVCLAAFAALVRGAPNPGNKLAKGDFFCYHCEDATENTECKAVTQCPSDQDRCLTQVWFNEYGLTISKRCSKMQICYNYEENNPKGCHHPDERLDGFCSYCCDSPECNEGLPPYSNGNFRQVDDGSSGSSGKKGSSSSGKKGSSSSSSEQHTTKRKKPITKVPMPKIPPTTSKHTVPTTTVTTTKQTTKPTTTTHAVTTSEPRPSVQCQVCGDWAAGVPCGFKDIMMPQYETCGQGEYCMTDALWVDSAGTNKLFKRCVSEGVCNKEWYHETSDKSTCMQADQRRPSSGTECHFCCTKPHCNQGVIPTPSTLFRP